MGGENACAADGCKEGYELNKESGECENADDCTDDSCANGGVCVDGLNEVSCLCEAGFEGDKCETNVDDCDPNPCQNGGECTDGDDSFSCSCKDGYKGETCSGESCAVDNCITCKEDKTDKCETCKSGYKPSKSFEKCFVDEPCKIPKCATCNYNGRRCRKCADDFKLSNSRKKCLGEDEEDPDCPSGDCEPTIIDENGNGIDDDEEDRDPEPSPKCNVKNCAVCKADNSLECDIPEEGYEVDETGN